MPVVRQFRVHTLGKAVERAGDEQDVHDIAWSPVRGGPRRTTAAFRRSSRAPCSIRIARCPFSTAGQASGRWARLCGHEYRDGIAPHTDR
ncbi:hypothetical protein STAFG_5832 [Streptomyces afghaniensis 772]|uniref:Uncharacterized protein n=1 Tax=Streptomyces afghaniensis 772 TaxID=1283301 RepID=S4MU09_9ACTN|nr:hypothetical protein STAFG_5832 [Streptomyces afghaniensis 772]